MKYYGERLFLKVYLGFLFLIVQCKLLAKLLVTDWGFDADSTSPELKYTLNHHLYRLFRSSNAATIVAVRLLCPSSIGFLCLQVRRYRTY